MQRNRTAKLGFMIGATNLGRELKQRRGSRSLHEIAKDCGVSIATLSRIEAGKIEVPSRETLIGLSYGYDMPLEMLAQLVYLGDNSLNPEAPDDTETLEDATAAADIARNGHWKHQPTSQRATAST